ncbi:MAG: hypothetical protein HS101_15105 [Planctomycetia bacterium]|nr:hypothetical protein [Planctomycetia bacterium]MCC7313828.1 hypothetical protein [Planctomycetota bacterium]
MQAGSYSWRGGEGSQTDLNGDDRKPPERVQDPRYPENPNATCCDEGEETAAVARSQPATGFVYMVNRFYEPETGRFTQADSLSFDPTQLTNAQNNRWTYCDNDPVNATDISGLCALAIPAAGTIGTIALGTILYYLLIVAIILLLFYAIWSAVTSSGGSARVVKCLWVRISTGSQMLLTTLCPSGVAGQICCYRYTNPGGGFVLVWPVL